MPDAATYLAEVSRWSLRGRWPVLLADDHLAPMFIRRFRPARVILRDPVGEPLPDSGRRQAVTEAIIRVWGGDPAKHTLRDVFEARDHIPPGVVVASMADPAWTAALALAAGRGQPVLWLDESLGRPNQTLDRERLARLQTGIARGLAETGYAYDRLGDAIDAITVCRALSGRVAAGGKANGNDRLAITDTLGRGPNGARYAFAGWIFGDETRCAYAAMCSLFLDRSRYWLYNTYPDTGAWASFGVDAPAATLRAAGFDATTFSGRAAVTRAWLARLAGGISTDVLVMNSKGNAGFFDLGDGRAYSGDVPVLNEPVALHLVHSWSLRSPDTRSTVGGQFLAHGVYAYVGSVQEPNLQAFVPPAALVKRWVAGVPFLIAARHWNETAPWRINTIGDPLMLCRPAARAAQRWPAEADDPGVDLAEQVKTLMLQADADATGEAYGEAIAALSLLGADDVAARMWRLAESNGAADAASAEALGALFRVRAVDDFARAWQAAPSRDDLAVTMLWHLMTPRLAVLADPDTLLLLQSVARPHQIDTDLERLAPHLTAAFGVAHTRNVIQREIEKTSNPRLRKRLERLLREQR